MVSSVHQHSENDCSTDTDMSMRQTEFLNLEKPSTIRNTDQGHLNDLACKKSPELDGVQNRAQHINLLLQVVKSEKEINVSDQTLSKEMIMTLSEQQYF